MKEPINWLLMGNPFVVEVDDSGRVRRYPVQGYDKALDLFRDLTVGGRLHRVSITTQSGVRLRDYVLPTTDRAETDPRCEKS